MQSLWRDGDLKIENNHTRQDYAEYFRGVLRPDYLTRGTIAKFYSVHPVGLPFIGAPVYALAGYRGIVVMIVLLSALTAVLMWRWTEALTRSAEAATFAWAAVFLSTPIVLHSFAVYPEMVAACCVMVALAWNPDPKREPAVGEYLVRGLAVAALPWLSTKYAPMAAVLVLVLAFRTLRHWRALAAVVGPFAISLAGWFWFFYWIWPACRRGPRTGLPRRCRSAISWSALGDCSSIRRRHPGVAPALAIGLTGFVWLLMDRRHHAPPGAPLKPPRSSSPSSRPPVRLNCGGEAPPLRAGISSPPCRCSGSPSPSPISARAPNRCCGPPITCCF